MNSNNIISNKNILKIGKDNREKILDTINSFPGIRYRDILRLTRLNNGTLSHHLSTLEKKSFIKIARTENSNITRYYPASTPSEETLSLNYLKIKTTRKIILMLADRKSATFNEIVDHTKKAPSTTSWNLKRLIESKVVERRRGVGVSIFFLCNQGLIEKIVSEDKKTLLDRSVTNYISIIDEL